jgi:hypothetical protein
MKNKWSEKEKEESNKFMSYLAQLRCHTCLFNGIC